MNSVETIIQPEELILVTGAAGFMGPRVVEQLLERGFRNLRCFVRPSSNVAKLEAIIERQRDQARIEIVRGNLLSREDCLAAAKDVVVIYHLAAGRGEKFYADAFMNSVVTTRNLLEATRQFSTLKRFVSLSSFAVYTNRNKPRTGWLDESCPIEQRPECRGDAYSFAKVKQDELVAEYGAKYGIPYVIVRPGVVYGPGNEAITGRIGIGTFGVFLHLGGGNSIPFTFVDNCADAVVLAGLKPGVDGEAFNVVDDHPLRSRQFLKLYKQSVRRFFSVYVPHWMSFLMCWVWEKYSAWSQGQLPPTYNRAAWYAYWKKTRYSNEKIKTRLGWVPRVTAADALARHFESCRRKVSRA